MPTRRPSGRSRSSCSWPRSPRPKGSRSRRRTWRRDRGDRRADRRERSPDPLAGREGRRAPTRLATQILERKVIDRILEDRQDRRRHGRRSSREGRVETLDHRGHGAADEAPAAESRDADKSESAEKDRELPRRDRRADRPGSRRSTCHALWARPHSDRCAGPRSAGP